MNSTRYSHFAKAEEGAGPTAQGRKHCIYCFRPDNEVQFTREHIIPQNIGGTLFIDEVCTGCNSFLGSNVDAEILKIHETLQILNELKIPHNKEGIIKAHYTITGNTDNLTVPFRAVDEYYEMLPRKLPDGSLLFPETHHEKKLRRIVAHDRRLDRAGVTVEQRDVEIAKLLSAYRDAKPGDIVHSPVLGRSLKKRADTFKMALSPRAEAQIEMLIAKIFYEFLYFVGGPIIFKEAQALDSLINYLNTGQACSSVFVFRENPVSVTPVDGHFVQFIVEPKVQICRIGFFGRLVWCLSHHLECPDFWQRYESESGIEKIRGLYFEQHLDSHTKNFWWIDLKGELVRV